MGCWSWVSWDASYRSASNNTHECNDIDRCDAVVQVAFALLRNEEISALLPVADGWVAIVPGHIDLSRNLLKPERSDLLEIRLHSFVGEVFWVRPVEKINVEIERLGRRTPIAVTFRSWLQRYLLWEMGKNLSWKCFKYITSAFPPDYLSRIVRVRSFLWLRQATYRLLLARQMYAVNSNISRWWSFKYFFDFSAGQMQVFEARSIIKYLVPWA